MSEEEFERLGLFITDPGIPKPGSARAKYWAVMSEASRARTGEDALRLALSTTEDYLAVVRAEADALREAIRVGAARAEADPTLALALLRMLATASKRQGIGGP
jgi:hypothetical protein